MGLSIGDKMPVFYAKNQQGIYFDSSDFIGSPCVIFFYPKDDTFLCTKEVCSFRDANEDFLKAGIKVFGISADSVEDHKAFSMKHALQYPLLSDPEHRIRLAFGVPKGLFGLLPGRVTYCFDKNGILLSVINASFSAETHVHEALKVFSSNIV